MPAGVLSFTNFLNAAEHLFWVLVRHQPHADFGHGLGRYHGFRASAGEAAGDAVNFKSGPRPDAIENRLAGLAGQLR